jgi:hypothetical protein
MVLGPVEEIKIYSKMISIGELVQQQTPEKHEHS